jgi:hypothetical protein
MKTSSLLSLAAALLGTVAAHAQGGFVFDSGSSGALGDLVVSNAVVIALPPDGVLNYKRVEIQEGGVVRFTKNALNTPVTLLAQQEVVIIGDLFLDGSGPSGVDPGRGGPGGFDGGRGAVGGQPGGPGKGPGGGLPAGGNDNGPGAFATRGSTGGARETTAGTVYGDPLLLPIIGGSGGGGSSSDFTGGGGGGGAILIASSVRISLPAAGHGIYARGAEISGRYNDGSGGGIRLVAPIIEGVGNVHAQGGPEGGAGRVRFDSPNAGGAALSINGVWTIGSLMLTKLPVEPKLNILKIGDKDIPQDSGGVVSVIFPNGSPAERTVVVQAKDFGSIVPIRLALIPDYGDRVVVDTEINNTAAGVATVNVPVTFPLNVVVTVNVWTR